MKLLAIAAVLFATMWVVLIPTDLLTRWSNANTIEKLKLTQFAVNLFEKQFHRLPISLAEIRTFLLSQNIDFHPYDSYGRRLSYVPLSESEYFVKSFGEDAAANSIGTQKDLSIVHMESVKRIPASQNTKDRRLMHIFPAPLLVGNRPDSTPYFARIITNESTYNKRLIVRGMQDTNFIITAFHENVHEFLWLDKDSKIIFTANGSSRYRDGIYLWNIKTDKTENVLTEIQERFFPKSKSFYTALSSVDIQQKKAYVFVQPKTNAALNPDNFYRRNKLFTIDYSRKKIKISRQKAPNSIFEFRVSPQDGMKVAPLALQEQKEWYQLATVGDLEKTLISWQNYCTKYSSSTLRPYCLWWLTSLYCDASKQLAELSPEKARVMQNYGLETARFLDEQIFAPEYLRAMGLYISHQLENRNYPDHAIGEFTIAVEEAL